MRAIISPVLFLIFGISPYAITETINLCTDISPPYQIKSDEKISGIAVDEMNCISKKMKNKNNIRVVPWRRCENEVFLGSSDGFFSTAPNIKRSQNLIFTNPIALAKWYWYFSHEEPSKRNNIGTIRGSIEEAWLKENGYNNIKVVSSLSQLIKLLDNSRIDAFIADEDSFKVMKEKSKIIKIKFKTKFVKYVTLGAYFSKPFIADRPNFISTFNELIYDCQQHVIKLNKSDLLALNKVVKDIRKFTNHDVVYKSVESQNKEHKYISNSKIIELDAMWRNSHSDQSKNFKSKIDKKPLSKYLQSIKRKSNGLYNEIFIMDNKGLNVGQSAVTSDYWQGDEDKFLKTYGSSLNSIFIDNIEFDQSTRKFQSQISLTIIDPKNKKSIGVVTVGVDVEKALSIY